jgi:hypothetical protein
MAVFFRGSKSFRRISHYETDDSPYHPEGVLVRRPVPVLNPGESYAWTMAGTCHIFEGFHVWSVNR